MRLTTSKEDYLKAIAEAESEGETVIAAAVARWLEVSPPAVTLALKRLQRDKVVKVHANGRISLTKAGRRVTNRLRIRHHLIERLLSEMVGMEWYKVHDEAERLEHAVSEDFERKLIEKLGLEGPCPHGNQITKSPGLRRRAGLQPLSEIEAGQWVRVVSMQERDRQLLEYLDALAIRPGTRARVISHNYDETVTLNVKGTTVPLGVSAARRIWVKPAIPS